MATIEITKQQFNTVTNGYTVYYKVDGGVERNILLEPTPTDFQHILQRLLSEERANARL